MRVLAQIAIIMKYHDAYCDAYDAPYGADCAAYEAYYDAKCNYYDAQYGA